MSRTRVKPLTLDEATRALAGAEQTRARWDGEAADKAKAAEQAAAELAELEARAGDDLLDDEDPEALAATAERLLALKTQQGLAVKATDAARGRVDVARRDVTGAKAVIHRARAVRLREAAAAHSAKTDQLLAELQKHERVMYAPAARGSALGTGSPLTPKTLTQQVLGRAQWLDGQAEQLEYLAAEGPADRVLAAVNTPLPEQLEVEQAVLGEVEPAPAA